ncbi:pyrroline-5-carboxylate reductase [Pokkaliibacter plantistimulans]|uniref:Pyrroline-5-carboxylate reductase n=1 Tax=Proteobacteria bacterium 228 TaxID=2083153 RepID=A0A2S5KLQ9_9PROT|nr:pyrroline-5-carboxylate reductase [Pokkaliibacter plantistimulans]PPC75246.1 pyrroline-5-carboxylate reductase [Pokkaliibacter plantistimulans]
MSNKITFIGAGNMASAIFGGLISSGYSPSLITATSPVQAELDSVRQRFGIHTSSDNLSAAANADIIVLAVKPQIMQQVCEPLAAVLQQRSERPLIISIAAGAQVATLDHWLGGGHAIVRTMPNTPALVGAGATGMFASAEVSATQRAAAEQLLGAVGIVEWVSDEALINAVTAISGSGPAYFFLFLTAMTDAGVNLGLPRDTARRLALQTGLGAAQMALASEHSTEQLMRNVMSPKGTTERAIATFEDKQLRQIVQDAMDACAQRAEEMQSEFGC